MQYVIPYRYWIDTHCICPYRIVSYHFVSPITNSRQAVGLHNYYGSLGMARPLREQMVWEHMLITCSSAIIIDIPLLH